MISLKNIFFFFFFLLSTIPFSSFSQYSLTIEINGLRNSNGQILLEFCNEKEVRLMGITQNVIGKKCIIIIPNLKPGKYAFKYIHDENKNKIMDINWIGIPIEGYGFSNNATGTFGPPSFEKTIFVLKENVTLKCSPTYY